MGIWYLFLSATIFTLVLISCGNHQTLNPEMAFSSILDVSDVNSSIKFDSTPHLVNPNALQPTFIVKLNNTSEHYILFPSDYRIRLFLYSDDTNQWIEIENKANVASDLNLVLAPSGSDGAEIAFVPFHPDLEATEYPVDIRVVVSGNVIIGDDEIGEQVAAYVDLHLDY